MECVRDTSPNMAKENGSNKDEMFVTVTLNGCSHHSQFSQEILICGSKGHLVLRNENLYIRKKTGREVTEELLHAEKEPISTSDNNNKISSSDCNRLPEMFPKGASLLFRHLSNTLKSAPEKTSVVYNQSDNSEGNTKSDIISLASFEDGLYVQAVMEAIRLSSREKCWAKVNEIDNSKEK